MSEPQSPRRGIRSYVLRQGRMNPDKVAYLDEQKAKFSVQPQSAATERVLEIGFGMGASFCAQAAQLPEIHFVGAEVHTPGIIRVLETLEETGTQNVQVHHGDVMALLDRADLQGYFTRIQIFFPDPWPKKRHQKRRLIQPAFLAHLAKVCAPGACCHIATDWADYADTIQETLQQTPLWAEGQPRPFPGFCVAKTKYAQRGIRLGHTIYEYWLTLRAK